MIYAWTITIPSFVYLKIVNLLLLLTFVVEIDRDKPVHLTDMTQNDPSNLNSALFEG